VNRDLRLSDLQSVVSDFEMTLLENTQAAIQTTCWSCQQRLTDAAPFCPVCGKVQPAEQMDYFSSFGLRRKLNLDAPSLEKEFYRLSRRLHPDVHARASAEERSWSLQRSSLLNDAYRTLRDPIARTEYVLELEGVQLEEQSRAATDKARATGEQKQQVVPPDLLEEVFDLNMQLEEMRMSKKMGGQDENTARDLQAAKARFEGLLNDSTGNLRQLWNEWDRVIEDGAGADHPKRVAVREKMVDLLNRRNYIRNLVRDVNEVLG
jgi:molecular chaperone HscB